MLGELALGIDVKTDDELRSKSVSFTHRLGFETVTIMAVQDRIGEEPVFRAIDNVSSPGARAMQDDPARGPRDPVMQHCKTSNLPIVWSRDTYERAGKAPYWEEQAVYGFCTGIAVASHLPNGRHLLVGLDRDQSLPRDEERLKSLVAEVQLFTACVIDTSFAVLMGNVVKEERPRLTHRELEAMRWTMEGKTAWEVGRILGISERTAARHLNNATRKLQCTNKMHAIVKALRLRMIA